MKGTNMGIFDKHLLVSDFDGTLINSRQQISKENLEAIKYFTANGGLFCGATGRTQFNLGHYLDGLPLGCPFILYNGACLYDFPSRTMKRITVLKREPLRSILKKIMAMFPSICVHLYTKERLYLVNPQGRMDKFIIAEKQEFYQSEMDQIQEPWIKIVLHEENQVLQKIYSILSEKDRLSDYHTFFSIGTYLEITNVNVSKGSALVNLRKELKGRISRVIAIGDYLNDLEMLENADIKAAPLNAHPKIRSIANYITAHHDQNAIADLVYRLELNLVKSMHN